MKAGGRTMRNETEAKLKKALRAKADESLRRRVVEFSNQVGAGESQTETALRLGMKPNTLHRWRQRARKARPAAVEFVEVTAQPLVEDVEVVWPSGHLVRMNAGAAGDLRSLFSAVEAACCRRG